MLFLILLQLFGICYRVNNESIRGVSPDELQEYHLHRLEVACDGRRLTAAQINDDYCDCPETGFDEPGTNACALGKFYCANEGFHGGKIDSFKVNDGVCDCCDGSDEYKGYVTCQNTCVELSRVALQEQELLQRIRTLGLKAKGKLLEDGMLKYKQLSEKKRKLEAQVELVSARKHRAEDDQKRSLASPSLKKALADQKLLEALLAGIKAAPEDPIVRRAALSEFDRYLAAKETRVSIADDSARTAGASQSDSKDESGMHTRETLKLSTDDNNVFEPSPQQQAGINPPTAMASDWKAVLWGYLGNQSVTEILYQLVGIHKKLLRAHKTSKPMADNVANSPAKILEDLEGLKKREEYLRQELKNAKQQLAFDLGPTSEYASMLDRCFKYSSGKYIYEMCPYAQAKQTSADGLSTTLLGNWENWDQNYTLMHFKHGASCWKGPQRSLLVKLECGEQEEIVSVDEPKACEYIMRFKTPLGTGGYRFFSFLTMVKGGRKKSGPRPEMILANEIDEDVGEVDGDISESDSALENSSAGSTTAQSEDDLEALSDSGDDSIGKEGIHASKKAKKSQQKAKTTADLSTAISAILRQSTPAMANPGAPAGVSSSTPILSKRKAIERQIDEEKLEHRARALLRREKLANRDQQRIIPDPSTANAERILRKSATKGVVQLFNAISVAQSRKDAKKGDKNSKAGLKAAEGGTKVDAKSDLKSISKSSFLELLKTSGNLSKHN